MTTTAAARLHELRIQLSEPTETPNYAATVQSGTLPYTSGQLPLRDGALIATGLLGRDIDISTGQAIAQCCALNVLAQVARTRRPGEPADLCCTSAWSSPGHAMVLLPDLGFAPRAWRRRPSGHRRLGHPLPLDGDAVLLGDGVDIGGEVLLGLGHHVVVRVAQVEGDDGLVGDDVGLARPDVEVPNGVAQLAVVAAVAHAAGLDDDLGGDETGVVPGGDRGGAGVGGLAVHGEPLPGDGLDALDDADQDVGLGQDRTLFDVALDIGVGDRSAFVGWAVEADALELLLDRLAVDFG